LLRQLRDEIRAINRILVENIGGGQQAHAQAARGTSGSRGPSSTGTTPPTARQTAPQEAVSGPANNRRLDARDIIAIGIPPS